MSATAHPLPKLLLTQTLPTAVNARLEAHYRPLFWPDARGPWPADAADCRALLVTPRDRLDATLIAQLPASLGLIASFSVGINHIDVAAATARALAVTNTPDVLTDATADLTLLLILGATRRAHEGASLLRSGGWTGWTPTQLLGSGLQGKRLGILGMGRIGQAVAHRARAFGLSIHYHNRQPLPADLAQGAIYHADLDDLLAQADIFALHCPLSAATHQLIDRAKLALLPRGAVLINAARGEVMVDDDVLAALEDGHLSALGLDVYSGEPALDPRYRQQDRAFLLPHLGSATVETRNAMGFTALDNIDAFFAGLPLPNRVT